MADRADGARQGDGVPSLVAGERVAAATEDAQSFRSRPDGPQRDRVAADEPGDVDVTLLGQIGHEEIAQIGEQVEGLVGVHGRERRTAKVELRSVVVGGVEVGAEVERDDRAQRVEPGVDDVLNEETGRSRGWAGGLASPVRGGRPA